MLRNVMLKTLRDQRRALAWWAIGLIAMALYTVLLYPSLGETPGYEQLLEQMPPALKAFIGETAMLNTPEGFVNAELYSFMVPIAFLLFTIAQGSGAIAGEEERGTLELLLANPLPRWRVVLEKWAAMVPATLALAVTLWVGIAVAAIIANIDVNLGRVAEATASAVFMAVAFGTLALALGCARGSRGLSIAVVAALAVATYLTNGLGLVVDFMEPYRVLSPFYYYSSAEPMFNGLNWGHAAILMAVTLVELAIAVAAFSRRDLAA